MESEKNPLEELQKEVARLLESNRKFLDKVLDEEVAIEDEDGLAAEGGEKDDFEEL